ncbi:hypothetical protein [Erythrobacter ani]|uniref:ABM domain-containing protein n=1 Tax=Erythrobacter ani TaxID=2827235 RepID=A0ABS6SSA8_9SPHN|nr:hypothetical protein [Erythrobacter ani]MBV7267549.1 hypothetical protein [Erythrobacter ani]
MVRRTRSKAKTIEACFPIRVRVTFGPRTLPGTLEAIERWAVETLGRGRVATLASSTTDTAERTLYFRSLTEAAQCFAYFDELQLQDYVSQTTLENEPADRGVFSDLRKSI